jgi:hypothetical protein
LGFETNTGKSLDYFFKFYLRLSWVMLFISLRPCRHYC